MTVRQFNATLRRRWYVLAVVGLCTMAAVWGVHKRSITYQACDALFVTAPSTPNKPNAYTDLESSLDATTGLITREVGDPATQAQLRSQGLTAAYTAEMTNTGTNEVPAYGQPTLQICSNSTDPVMALRTTDGATKEFQAILHDRQVAQHVAPRSQIGATVLASPSVAPIYGHPSQAYLGVMIFGLISGVALTLWTDPLLERRNRWKGARRRAQEAIRPQI